MPFGSAAEGKLRATSDVNVLVVVSALDAAAAEALREPVRLAEATIALAPMFLLESELEDAAEAFAVKFADVRRRRRVLQGEDPFARLAPSRQAEIRRLRQVTRNLALRLRRLHVSRSLHEERVAAAAADAAGPLRSFAAALLELRGTPAPDGKEALRRVLDEADEPDRERTLALLSEARETGPLPAGAADTMLLRLAEAAGRLRERAAALETTSPR